jgi:hypothetical protein
VHAADCVLDDGWANDHHRRHVKFNVIFFNIPFDILDAADHHRHIQHRRSRFQYRRDCLIWYRKRRDDDQYHRQHRNWRHRIWRSDPVRVSIYPTRG